MLAALRRARYGYLLAFHVLLLCAAGRTPTDIAAVPVLLALQCLLGLCASIALASWASQSTQRAN